MKQQNHTSTQPNSPSEAAEAQNDCIIDPSQETRDHIQPLPGNLLSYILSFLPTDDAVRTSVLPRRWKHLWTYIWNLEFRSRGRSKQDFISFVDNSLGDHGSSKIVKFYLDFLYDEDSEHNADRWIRTAILKGVEILYLKLSWSLMHANLPLPDFFYEYASFRELKLTRYIIKHSESIRWGMLVRLSLKLVVLSDNAMKLILSGCPLLEDLGLVKCLGLTVLNVSSPNVKRLILEHFGTDLSIFAPSLRSLTLSGRLIFASYRHLNFSSLKDAQLDCGFFRSCMDEFENSSILAEFGKILANTKHAEVLTVSYASIKVFTMFALKGLPISFSNRTCLILETGLQKWELPGIYDLLRSSPNLEILIIRMKPLHHIKFERLLSKRYSFEEEKLWEACNVLFSNLMHRLKTVEVHSCLGWYADLEVNYEWMTPRWLRQKAKAEVKLATLLLKNAAVLERLKVYFGVKENIDVPEVDDLISEMSKVLLWSSKASRSVEILIS